LEVNFYLEDTSQYQVSRSSSCSWLLSTFLACPASASVWTAGTWAHLPIHVSVVAQRSMPAYLQHRQPGRLCV